MSPERYRSDFAPLRVDDPVTYLDNACTTLKPDSVVSAITDYYTQTPGCGGRSAHRWGTAVTMIQAQARRSVAEFINADESDVVFTQNGTAGINQVAYGIDWQEGDVVLTSDKEHNSNLVPWMQLEKAGKVKHQAVESGSDNLFDIEAFEEACASVGRGLRLVSIPTVSNLDGVSNPASEICKIAHDHGAEVLLDAAQSVPHSITDVKAIGCDYLTFSLHKMLGPSGVGILYGKHDSLLGLETRLGGGKTISELSDSRLSFKKPPHKFEGGSANWAGIAGTKAAVDYLKSIDFSWLQQHESNLNRIISEGVKDLHGVSIIGPEDYQLRGGLTSLTVAGLDVHDLAIILDEAASVLVRSGLHCVDSWFIRRGIPDGSLRTSVYLYNSEEEARRFVDIFEEAITALSA